MVERTELYTTKEQRLTIIAAAEALGETMQHDDFNVGPNGENRLTFDVLPPRVTTRGELRLRELYVKLGLS